MRRAFLAAILACFLMLALPASGITVPSSLRNVSQAAQLTTTTVTKITTTPAGYSPGAVVIQSYPPGAEIWKDGSDLHHVTPYTLTVPVGATIPSPYQITLKYPGYQDYSTTVTPRTGETQTISAKLVALTTSPAGIVTTVTATSPVTSAPVTQMTRQASTRSVVTVTQVIVPVNVSTRSTTGAAGTLPAPVHTPRRVPGFEAPLIGLILAVLVLLKRNP